MGRASPATEDRIGPNAILQVVPVLDAALGEDCRRGIFQAAAVQVPPQDAGMLCQDDVIRLHGYIAQALPDLAPGLMRAAGLATGDYILANRIPAPAKLLIRTLPRPMAARVLSAAIARHAWTFVGSGVFRIDSSSPLIVSILNNPLAAKPALTPGCHWHAAVFQRLFSSLVWPKTQVVELTCCSVGDAACRFRITPEVKTCSTQQCNV